MKYLILYMLFWPLYFAFLAWTSGCTTSNFDKEVTDNMSATFAGHAECSDYDEMSSDIEDIVEDLDCADEDFNQGRYLKRLPDGAWSAKAICCYAAVQEVKSMDSDKLYEDWQCRKAMPLEVAVDECQKLE